MLCCSSQRQPCFVSCLHKLRGAGDAYALQIPVCTGERHFIEQHRHFEAVFSEELAQVRIQDGFQEPAQRQDVAGGRVPRGEEILHDVVNTVGLWKNFVLFLACHIWQAI